MDVRREFRILAVHVAIVEGLGGVGESVGCFDEDEVRDRAIGRSESPETKKEEGALVEEGEGVGQGRGGSGMYVRGGAGVGDCNWDWKGRVNGYRVFVICVGVVSSDNIRRWRDGLKEERGNIGVADYAR